MTGDQVPRQRDVRMSDADRERVVARLQSAVSEGRLTLDEFQERVDGVLRSRTFGEIDQYVADLPGRSPAGPVTARDVLEIRSTASALRRHGRWSVPRRLVIHSWAGPVKLDFTEAVIAHPVVEVVLDVFAGSTTLLLPDDASANADAVVMTAGRLKVHRLPFEPGSGSGPHFLVTGTHKAGGLTIRPKYRFMGWRW